MKILFISGEFPPLQGGVGDYTRELGLALRDLGCQVQVVSSTGAGPVEGLTVHPLVECWGWGSWRTLLDLIRRERPDVVHVQYQAAAYGLHPAINFWPRRLRRLGANRPRSVVTFHDLRVPYLFPKAGPLRRWVVNELARRSDAAITTNRADFENLSRELGYSSSAPASAYPFPPVALIPIGSNIASPQPPPKTGGEVAPSPLQAGGTEGGHEAWRARWGAAPDDLLLCFFGFINEKKGVDILLHALRLVASNPPNPPNPANPANPANPPNPPNPPNPANPLLLFIGGQTGASDPTNVAYLDRIEQLIADLGLQGRVRWTGYLPDEEVSASFAAADLCILPFRDGVSFLHGTFHAALVHGAAIVTTQPALPLPELVHGENVWLVPPEDPPALAEAIAHLAADPALRRTLGKGAKILSQQFRWDKIAADTLALYQSIA